MPMIREIPCAERPREKLLNRGASFLSNTELIAVLIGSGTRGQGALALADMVLAEAGYRLASLKSASPEELSAIKGIGEAAASRILAAAELGARMTSETTYDLRRVTSPDDVYEMFAPELCGEKQEIVQTLLLNAKYDVIGREIISKGGIMKAYADPRDVFRPAVKRGATGVIIIHNHPSGDPTPSDEDMAITEKLEQAGALIGVALVDHIIIGSGRHVSLRGIKSCHGDV